MHGQNPSNKKVFRHYMHIKPYLSHHVYHCGSENMDSQSSFLVQMGENIVDMERDIVIIFDRLKGLMEVVPFVFPNAHHSYYLCHLAWNPYGGARNDLIRKYIWVAVRQFRESAFIE